MGLDAALRRVDRIAMFIGRITMVLILSITLFKLY